MPDRAALSVSGGALHGALGGACVASAYCALELLLFGPFTREAYQSIGAWYARTMFAYAAIYAALGALIGLAVGAAVARAGRARHHVLPTVSALLMLAFLGNAWVFGHSPAASLFLAVLPPLALWLLVGLLFAAEDPVRSFIGSPWPAAVLTLLPYSVSRGDVVGLDGLPHFAAAAACVVFVPGLAWLSRSRAGLRRAAAWKPQGAFTIAVLALIFLYLGMSSTVAVSAMQAAAAPTRPDIVLITLDTTRADHLSVYGYPRKTSPGLERFAAGATLYRHAYAGGDMTLSSHGSMFTGLYPTQHGAHIERSDRSAVSTTVPTLGELLAKAGYRNYASVANSVFLDPMWGFARGFDRWELPKPLAVITPIRHTYQLRMAIYELTRRWLAADAMRQFAPAGHVVSTARDLVAKAGDRPFFLFVNVMEAHRPWTPTGPFRGRFPGYDAGFDELAIRSFQPEVMSGRRAVTADQMTKLDAAYDGAIANLDDEVGKLLEAFSQEAWYDSSLIIVTADHGELLGDKNLLDHGDGVDGGLTSIPMIVKFPGQAAAREVRSPVSHVDVFSTILATAGVPLPGPRPGADLTKGDPGGQRDLIVESFPSRVFIHANAARLDRMERAIVRGPWKLIVSTKGRRELYDMDRDPIESRNVAADYPEIARGLEESLAAWAAAAEARRPPRNLQKRQQRLMQRLKALGYLQ